MTSEEHTALIQLIFIIFVTAVIGVIIWAVVTMHKTAPHIGYLTDNASCILDKDGMAKCTPATIKYEKCKIGSRCEVDGYKFFVIAEPKEGKK